MRLKNILTIAAALLPIAGYAEGIKVAAPSLVAADEQFKVMFTIEGEGKPSDFVWNCPGDFQLVWGPQKGYSSSTSIINGKVTQSNTTSYTYILLPKSTGSFTLPGATAKLKNKVLSSQGFTIEVVSDNAGARNGAPQDHSQQGEHRASPQNQGGEIFLKLILSSTSAVVGQPLNATIKLYQRADITDLTDAKFPSFNGFWSQDISPDGNIQFSREKVGDQIWNSAVIKKYVLIPQRAGDITIDPAELVCRVAVRAPSRGNSIFDGFFDDYTTLNKRVTTQATRIKVSPLPSGAPASFGGGVGEFKMSAKLSKDSLSTHEAASLSVTISGRGNVALLEAPKVNFPPDFEAYDLKSTEQIDKGSTSGIKTYEYPFIPRSGGDFTIEPVKYSYYDVSKGKYVTLESAPIQIKVARGSESEASAPGVVVPGVAKKGVKNLGEDIRFITTKNPSLKPLGSFFAGSGLFYGLLGALGALALGLWVALRKIAARRADVVGAKNRKATKMALRRLKLSESYLKQNLYSAFYEELHKALLSFVGDKFNIPLGELSRERISEALEGSSKEALEEFLEVLDACEFARYAPDSGHEAMASHYQKAVEAISSLEKSMKHSTPSKVLATMIVALLCLPFAASAQQADYADSLWNKAGSEYSQGHWQEAAELYSDIADAGLESAQLYCNIGNAYYKMASYAKAILFYERALKLDPSYSDARYNLSVAQSFAQDDIEQVPEFILKTWWRKLCYSTDATTWAVLCLLFFAITLGLVLLFVLGSSPAVKRTGFFTGIAFLLLSAACLDFSLVQKRDYFKDDAAIVMRSVSAVKSSPSAEGSADLFVLHEGTKVKILDGVASWTNIRLSDGREGWIKTDDIEKI